MSKGQAHAVHENEIWAGLIGLPFGYLFFGIPAILVFSLIGKNMSLIAMAYESVAIGLASLAVGIVVVGLVLWKIGDLIIPFAKGVFGGLCIRAMVQLVRTVMGYGPDPYTDGWLYCIRPVIEHVIQVLVTRIQPPATDLFQEVIICLRA